MLRHVIENFEHGESAEQKLVLRNVREKSKLIESAQSHVLRNVVEKPIIKELA